MSEVIAPHGGIRHGAGNKKRPREGAKFCSDAATKRLPSRTNNDRSHLNLPIHAYAKQIIDSVKSHQVTVLVGETGSGKSTQLPQILLDHGLVPRDKGIVCTQPRRVAAVTIAQKVASERDVALGQEIGYSIRFEDKSSPATRIKYATDGVLLRECMSDDSLSKYHIVILDEAHERSLQTDILIGLLRAMQTKRSADSLRIIIMSATLQVESFQAFFQVYNLVK
ncbi:DEAD/DEAH box helicase [archaeon]|nr:MAG: DEAD/DEAH box helicase [archaeon]